MAVTGGSHPKPCSKPRKAVNRIPTMRGEQQVKERILLGPASCWKVARLTTLHSLPFFHEIKNCY